jgi:diguanylate cyclase (GGDEF)-like protein
MLGFLQKVLTPRPPNDDFVLGAYAQRSIRNKVFACVLITSLAALVLTGIAMAVYELRAYRASLIQDLSTQADLIGRASIPALQFDDRNFARNNLALLEVRPQIAAAALYDANGALYASYGKPLMPLHLPTAVAIRSIESGNGKIYLTQPILQNSEVVGAIRLQAAYGFNERLLSYIGILLGAGSFALLVSLFLSSWLQAKITRPILAVTNLARKVVERRDYSLRANKTTEDEIGYMVDAFNGMLTEIEQRTKDQLAALRESEMERERTLYISQHDALTGLPNRAMFNQQLDEVLSDAEHTAGTVHILFIDVDRFKEINDSLGHYVGDILLAAVARRLQSHVRKEDFVARLSGDEFGIISRNHGRIKELASTLVHELSRPFSLNDYNIATSVSIGITCFPEDSKQAAQLLMNADMAMYGAKNSGRSNYQFYTKDLDLAAKRRQSIKTGLQSALLRDELAIYYQPVFSIEENVLCSVEALVRWPNAQIPLLSITELVAVAEDSGLIIDMGTWILNTVCKHAKAWQQQEFFLRVAVNISSRQLKEPTFISMVDQALRNNELAPEYLDLEITERVLVENNAINRDSIQILKSKGIQISVDDFGTGFSSLSYLKNFSVNALKIDQSFVHGLPFDKDDVAITTAIISLAQGLEINVVAEGIENAEQLAFLRALHCDRGQGYLFSQAVSADDFMANLKAGIWQHEKLPRRAHGT